MEEQNTNAFSLISFQMSTVLESAICHLIEISNWSGCSVKGHITFVNNGNNQKYNHK